MSGGCGRHAGALHGKNACHDDDHAKDVLPDDGFIQQPRGDGDTKERVEKVVGGGADGADTGNKGEPQNGGGKAT